MKLCKIFGWSLIKIRHSAPVSTTARFNGVLKGLQEVIANPDLPKPEWLGSHIFYVDGNLTIATESITKRL